MAENDNRMSKSWWKNSLKFIAILIIILMIAVLFAPFLSTITSQTHQKWQLSNSWWSAAQKDIWNSYQNVASWAWISNYSSTNNKNKIVMFFDKNCIKQWVQACNPLIVSQIEQWLKLWSWAIQTVILSSWNLEELKKYWINSKMSPTIFIWKNQIKKFIWLLQSMQNMVKQWKWWYYIPLFNWEIWAENYCNDWKDNNWDWKIDWNDPTCWKWLVLTSKDCTDNKCNNKAYESIMLWYNYKILDYNSWWKALFKKLVNKYPKKIEWLPLFFISKLNAWNKDFSWMFINLSWITLNWIQYKYLIPLPSTYNPILKECKNNCSISVQCKLIPKCNRTNKPDVKLFVMSYCPYWTQAEKWILPVINLLKNKINFSIKFVNYSMHGKKEVKENTLQHCIQKEESTKYKNYLKCFLKEWNSEECLKENWIKNNEKIKNCIAKVNAKYDIKWILDDKSKYIGWRFPFYPVDNRLNKKYWVQGSPTLVINWVIAHPKNRSPQSYLDLICKYFKNRPAECNKKLLKVPYVPNFGYKTINWQENYEWSCWTK